MLLQSNLLNTIVLPVGIEELSLRIPSHRGPGCCHILARRGVNQSFLGGSLTSLGDLEERGSRAHGGLDGPGSWVVLESTETVTSLRLGSSHL